MARTNYSRSKKTPDSVALAAKTEQESEKPADTLKAEYYGVVNAEKGLNARKEPNGEVIDILPNGTKVTITEEKTVDGSPWCHLSKPFEAWVMSRFIKIN